MEFSAPSFVTSAALPMKRKYEADLVESKSVTVGTKRRPYVGTVNRRLNKLYKIVKAHNPAHLYSVSLQSAFATISTTGSLYDLSQSIIQGDDPTTRFSSQCILKRLRIRGTFIAGSTSNTPSAVRITVFRAISGIAFAANLTSTYSPIAYSTATYLLYDKFCTVGATSATFGYPTNLDINIRLNHKQKFTGTGGGTQTGQSIYCIIQSDKTAGTTAPVLEGVMEIYFDPT